MHADLAHQTMVQILSLAHGLKKQTIEALATALLARFGTVINVVYAPVELQSEVVGERKGVIRVLNALQILNQAVARSEIDNRKVIKHKSELLRYCKTKHGYLDHEEFWIIFLNKLNVIISDEMAFKGTVDHVHVYSREILKKALNLGATAMIFVHNHPSGDVTPSHRDARMTSSLRASANMLGIEVHDHIIVGRFGCLSLREEGLL